MERRNDKVFRSINRALYGEIGRKSIGVTDSIIQLVSEEPYSSYHITRFIQIGVDKIILWGRYGGNSDDFNISFNSGVLSELISYRFFIHQESVPVKVYRVKKKK